MNLKQPPDVLNILYKTYIALFSVIINAEWG